MKYIILNALFVVLYFLHLPGVSLYIYDLFLILTIFYLLSKSKVVSYSSAIFLISFISVSLFIAIYSIYKYNHDFRYLDFFARLYRYSFILVIPLLFSEIGRDKEQKNITKVFFFFALIPVIYNDFMIFFASDYVMVFGRASSYFENPNTFGAYMCTVVMPMTAICFRLGYSKLIVFLSFLFSFIALVYIGSNSYWILSLASFFGSLVIMNGTKLSTKAIVGILSLLVILFLFLIYLFSNLDYLMNSEIAGLKRTAKLMDTLIGGDNINDLGSGNFRKDIELVAWFLIFDNMFIFGTGLGQSPAIIISYLYHNVTAHNAFIVALLENGVVGFSIFFGFFLFYTFKVYRDNIIGDINKRIVYVSFYSYLLACIATPNVYLPFTLTTIIFSFTQLYSVVRNE